MDRRIEVSVSPLSVSLPQWNGSDLIVQVAEEGINVELTVASVGSQITSDTPLPRQGVQRVVITREMGRASAIVRSIDQAGHRGRVRVVVSALPQGAGRGCVRFVRELARADQLFAIASAEIGSESPGPSSDPEARAVEAVEAYERVALSPAAKGEYSIRGEAELAVAAINYYQLNHWEAAAKWAGAAAENLAKADNPYLRARARALQAASWLEKPENARAIERARAVFEELAEFHRARGELYDQALQINFAGVSYFNEARFDLAVPRYTEAQALFTRLGETQRAALTLQNLALCEWGNGRIGRALPLFERALNDMDPELRPTHFLLTLNNAALANQAAGKFDESLNLLERALRLATRLGNKYYRARSLYGIGVTYYGIGDRELARQFLRDAIGIWTPELDERGRLAALRALAVIENESGELDLADQHNREALSLARSPLVHDRISLKMAETAYARGDVLAADILVRPLLGEAAQAERLTKAQALVMHAKLQARGGSFADAQRNLRHAIEAFQDLEALSEEFEARVELTRTLRAQGRNEEASQEIALALVRGEEISAQTANPEYRASVAGAIRPALDLRLDLLWDAYERDVKNGNLRAADEKAFAALAIADGARARAFDQHLRRTPAQSAQDDALLMQRAEVMRDLAERRYYLATREDRAGSGDARAEKLRGEIRDLRMSLGILDTRIAGRPAPARASPPVVLGHAFERLARARNVAGIEYWIGTESAYAWVINQRTLFWTRLSDSAAITAAARHFHETLKTFATTPVRVRLISAERLHRLIVTPLERQLQGTDTWIIVADGPLHFIPFAALRNSDGEKQYLIERAAPLMTPALRYLPETATQREDRAGRLLLVSDPIYQTSDSRLATAVAVAAHKADETLPRLRAGSGAGSWLRLPATAREADGIRALFQAKDIDELSGPDANRGALLARDLANYRFVHIAAHGVMDAEVPAMSAIVLGAFDRKGMVQDQQVRAGDLMTRTLAADLVVLSACSTSLGPEYPDEGPMGLRYAVLARGARAVVASLWSTADELNAQLMTDMYARLIGKGQRPELALASAMLEMLKRMPNLDPALWAPFSVYAVKTQN